MFPGGRIYLEFEGIVKNRREQQILRQAIPGAELRDYYMKKRSCTKTVYNHINWKEFGRARHKNTNISRYVTKLCCRWLPTNTIMKLTEGISDTCKTCGEEKN
jgi:hypothetical protein